ncbi:MAG TPA: hypothetical protein VMU26_23020 [Candidatus Polarisedimenticolia bacterium]|nr:hypothetical protein [Candidatus Polarisedimenticolia bacterium]
MQRFTSFWWSVVPVVLGTAIVVVAIQRAMHIRLHEAATSVGSVLTAIAVLLAFRTLRAAHEWNRRNSAVQLMDKWNERARTHIEFLEHQFPDFFPVPDFLTNPDNLRTWRMDADRAKAAVDSLVPSESPSQSRSNDLEIRDRLIQLFNHFEDISIAYELFVLDRHAVEESFAPVMIEIYLYFQPFIAEMRRVTRRDPWAPLSRVADLWIEEARFRTAMDGLKDTEKRFQKALAAANEKSRRPTGE